MNLALMVWAWLNEPYLNIDIHVNQPAGIAETITRVGIATNDAISDWSINCLYDVPVWIGHVDSGYVVACFDGAYIAIGVKR